MVPLVPSMRHPVARDFSCRVRRARGRSGGPYVVPVGAEVWLAFASNGDTAYEKTTVAEAGVNTLTNTAGTETYEFFGVDFDPVEPTVHLLPRADEDFRPSVNDREGEIGVAGTLPGGDVLPWTPYSRQFAMPFFSWPDGALLAGWDVRTEEDGTLLFLSADAVKFYKAGSTTEDPTIRIVPGTVPRIVFDDPLNKDIVQAIDLEIAIADNDGFEGAPASFTNDQLVGLRDIVLQTNKLDTTVAPYDTLPEDSDPDRPALQPYKHPENDGIDARRGRGVQIH